MKENRQYKILFVIPSLSSGGAERVALNILKYLNRQKFTPYLALFEKKGVFLDLIPKDVVTYNLNKKNRLDLPKLILQLAYIIYPRVKPNVVISFLEYANLITVVARKLSLTKPSIVISEHSCPMMYQKYERVRHVKRLLVEKFYPRADKIVTVSKGIKEDLSKSFRIPNKKMQAIYNSIDFPSIKYLSQEPVDDISWFKEGAPVIVACGRLTRPKNYPSLLKAFAKIQRDTRARLLILGEGEDKKSLEDISKSLAIEKEVTFLGFRENPYKYMVKSAIFVSSSLWEGFGIVIIEAMACGIPVISTCCPYGPDEIITNGVNGLLVPVGDVDALAEAILRLLKDDSLRRRLAEAGRKRAEDFRAERMVASYERIFEEIIREGRINEDQLT